MKSLLSMLWDYYDVITQYVMAPLCRHNSRIAAVVWSIKREISRASLRGAVQVLQDIWIGDVGSYTDPHRKGEAEKASHPRSLVNRK